MIVKGEEAEKRTAYKVADLMAAAAKTAPKGCGEDKITTIILDGKDKDQLADYMREIGGETGADFFNRDAGNVDNSHLIVLIGTSNTPLGLEFCGMCGFEDCEELMEAGGNCAFNVTDLGIAIGSAVSIASDHRIDNRVLFSAGRAAIRMKCFDSDVKVCFGIPLSTSSKSIFFDRDPGNVLL